MPILLIAFNYIFLKLNLILYNSIFYIIFIILYPTIISNYNTSFIIIILYSNIFIFFIHFQPHLNNLLTILVSNQNMNFIIQI